MKLSRIPIYALALVSLAGSAALAQNPTPQGGPPMGGMGGMGGPGGGRGGQMMVQMLFKGITLTPAQQVKVDSIASKYADMRRQAVADGQNGDRDALRAKMRDMMAAQGKELRAVLTDDQAKQFDANEAELRQRMQNRGGGGGGR